MIKVAKIGHQNWILNFGIIAFYGISKKDCLKQLERWVKENEKRTDY